MVKKNKDSNKTKKVAVPVQQSELKDYDTKPDGEIILYQPDETIRLEVRLYDDTVWLTQAQIIELFQSSKANVSEHIKNIYDQEELDFEATVRNFRTVQKEGKRMVKRALTYYNLDAIISIGFRVNAKRGIRFRRWANSVIKQYMLNGLVINQRLMQIQQHLDTRIESQQLQIQHIEATVKDHQEKIDFFVRTSLPPQQGLYYDGQVFDAYQFVSDLVRKAMKNIVLIDNFVDDTVLTILDKRNEGVAATIYTQHISKQLQLDIERHNAQFPAINIIPFNKAHDRFLLIDNEVYHIGASIKDLGKKWFAFTLMRDLTSSELIEKINMQ